MHPFDRTAYKRRNLVERAFCRIKHFRRVATRYDKLAATYDAAISLADSHLVNRSPGAKAAATFRFLAVLGHDLLYTVTPDMFRGCRNQSGMTKIKVDPSTKTEGRIPLRASLSRP